MKIEINTNKVEKYLNEKEKDIKIGINDGINKATFFVQGEVKQSIAGHRAEPTSVDTGRFLNSVDLTTSKDEGKVFTSIPYAKFLEYGTSTITPRPHFRNSLARNQHKVNEIIKEEIKKEL